MMAKILKSGFFFPGKKKGEQNHNIERKKLRVLIDRAYGREGWWNFKNGFIFLERKKGANRISRVKDDY